MWRNTDRTRGYTFLEMLVGVGLLLVMFGMIWQWYFTQRRYQDRMLRYNEIQENHRRAVWRMIQELKTGRQVIWPRVNTDASPRTDGVVVFKNFRGEIVAFSHAPDRKEIQRTVIPNGVGAPAVDADPIGRGIASAAFTVMGVDNKLVSIHFSTEGVHQIDAVRLVNE